MFKSIDWFVFIVGSGDRDRDRYKNGKLYFDTVVNGSYVDDSLDIENHVRDQLKRLILYTLPALRQADVVNALL